ncbi:MAG: type II toxin-antitoxin system VapC family toxin [bacterium]
MSTLVVDASVAAKWFTGEELAEEALRVLDERYSLHAPDFFLLEMDSLICKWIRLGVINDSEGGDTRKAVRRVPIRLHSYFSFQDSAYHIAVQTHQSIYDCLYVALAVFIGGRMVTADRRLFKGFAAGPLEKYLLWIEDAGKPENK